ncbi:MAG: helix-hairpin-helix domain-containing protein [Ferruginibacter sp.]
MDNYQIADTFSLLSKLMDIHGENSFKSKSYSSAAFAIEKLPVQLSEMPVEKIAAIKGIGESTAKKIEELLQKGKISALEEKIFSTPPGVIEMLKIKGIGPKKIHGIWKEMEIETVGELLYACKENRLKNYKGFGEKTQQSVIEFIEFYLKHKHSHLYANVEMLAAEMQLFLQKIFPNKKISLTGKFKRQLPVVDELEYVMEAEAAGVTAVLNATDDIKLKEETAHHLLFSTPVGIDLKIYPCTALTFTSRVLETSSSEAFFKTLQVKGGVESEEDAFKVAKLPFIPSFLRENPGIIEKVQAAGLKNIIQPGDIRGIIHCHSNWSDGANTVEQMAIAARDLGLEYLVISDHSKSAFYAQGLIEEKIREQHRYVDELNEKLKPFKIFKSIESDILNDGSLDYTDEVLASFDLVIASVHSNLKMTQEKAMMRLLNAINNPYTTILGHMTGRLLLSRAGYPVDHDAVIDACIANNVVIELNANPHRLDMDWQYIEQAVDKGALISINPDSHETATLYETKYGVLVAQKAMLSKEKNLSSFSLAAFEKYISERKRKRGI